MTGMAHHEMAFSRCSKIAREFGGIILFRIKGGKTGKTVVGKKSPRGGLPCKSLREPRDAQGFRDVTEASP